LKRVEGIKVFLLKKKEIGVPTGGYFHRCTGAYRSSRRKRRNHEGGGLLSEKTDIGTRYEEVTKAGNWESVWRRRRGSPGLEQRIPK